MNAPHCRRRELAGTVHSLCVALADKDEYTGGHLRRVARAATEVGRRLRMNADELARLEVAALLHDVGKLAVPGPILAKTGPLDDEERAWIERHPELGARLLADLDGLAEVVPLVLHHQERYDGRREGPYRGYPDGLRGEEIPLGARIIAVVDAYDAMTSDRPYRPALSREAALATLRDERGGQFDPRVVDAFLALLAERTPW